MITSQKSREIIVQTLFSLDFEGNVDLAFLMRELTVSRANIRNATDKALLVWENRDSIDQKIGEVSKEYALNRIPSVEKNILRLMIYEAMNERETPSKVLISEAIRLARKFSSPEAGTFINAVLDPIFRSLGIEMASKEDKANETIELENRITADERELPFSLPEG